MAAAAADLALQGSPGGVGRGVSPQGQRRAAEDDAQLGPQLMPGMGEANLIERLNLWGSTRDREALDLRANLGATQVGVSTAFEQARDTLLAIVADFRTEAATLRQHGQYEAAQSVGRLEQVVAEARARFDAQDARFTDGLSELARRLLAVDAWAQAEPARVAAIVQAVPTQPRAVPTSPGGTPLTFYASPGLAAQQQQQHAPQTPQQPQWAPQTPQQSQDDPTGAGRGVSPQGLRRAEDPWAGFSADPWRAGPAVPELPGTGPRHFDMGTPGGRSGYPPKEMRIDGRSWGDHKRLDVATTFEGFQIWKDRALMFLSRERPDIRRLLTWAEGQSKDSLEADLPAHAAQTGVVDLAAAEYAIHDGIKLIIFDSLLGRARNCVERGCELWRSLCAEWSGAAPQLKQAKARRYQEPSRCKDTPELWTRLPAWERLGEEVKLAGLDLPEWLRSAALEKLLPAPLLATLVARPELSTYSARLA
jgi:hypothetical protein